MRNKKPVNSNTGHLFCFNSNVSNLYNNTVIIYKIKNVVRTVLFVNEFTYCLYYNIGQIIKLVHKKNCKKSLKKPKGQSESLFRRGTVKTMTKRKQYKRTNNDLQNIHIELNIALYQRPVTDITGRLYNSIADGIIVQVRSWYTYTLYQRPVTVIRGRFYNSIAGGIIVQVKSWYTYTLYQRPVTDIRGRLYNSIAGGIIVQVKSWYTCTNYDNCVVLFVFVYPRPISCVPNVADVSGLFIRVSLTFIYYISTVYIYFIF
jgi:hypothetical protein